MDGASQVTLARWGDLYLITGTAAAALTGLQFVVQSLLASDVYRPLAGPDPTAGIGAFGTPTVVHFTLAMIVSAVMCVPWSGYGMLRVTLALLGAGALGYSAVVLRRARRQDSYEPVAEDWIWHVLLPPVAYAGLLLAAVLLGRGAEGPLLVVAAATVLLLCIGIHNAWDTITFFTISVGRAGVPEAVAAPRSAGRTAVAEPAAASRPGERTESPAGEA
jgi:hypothetical protein